MSFASWHTYGYGIVVSDLANVTYGRVEKTHSTSAKVRKGV